MSHEDAMTVILTPLPYAPASALSPQVIEMQAGLQFSFYANPIELVPAVHAVVRRIADGFYWNGATFEACDAAQWYQYVRPVQGKGQGLFTLIIPVIELPAGGNYSVSFYNSSVEDAMPGRDPITTMVVRQWGRTPGAGPGSSLVTLAFYSNPPTNTVPVADADTWVTLDAAGLNVVAGTLQTNSIGQATFLLDPGVTYFVWMQKDGLNPIKAQPFTAVAD